MQEVEPNRLFKTVCYALRHEPWRFGLELTDEGFASLEALVKVVCQRLHEFSGESPEAAKQRIFQLDPRRFEVRGEADDAVIRARYGHSFPVSRLGEVAAPPEVLYHGTSFENALNIEKSGLQPIDRYFLHLTTDREYAVRVGTAKGRVFLWQVKAREALAAGIVFRRATPHVWLTSHVPARFLESEATPAQF